MNEFNFNSAVCTSIEQSRKLLSLGLKKETADMYLQSVLNDVWSPFVPIAFPYSNRPEEIIAKDVVNAIPAWSLHRLLSLLPDYIVVNSSSGLNPNFYLNIRDGFVSYKDNRGFSYGSISGNMYDAITRMISFLIKEGYFNKEYLV